jgi:hypothetical protein
MDDLPIADKPLGISFPGNETSYAAMAKTQRAEGCRRDEPRTKIRPWRPSIPNASPTASQVSVPGVARETYVRVR